MHPSQTFQPNDQTIEPPHFTDLMVTHAVTTVNIFPPILTVNPVDTTSLRSMIIVNIRNCLKTVSIWSHQYYTYTINTILNIVRITITLAVT